ncbi:MAG TPA: DUF4136 domain-containing protein [Gammaproteobacteria bacterium]|nr:DUF4136 domain-containing protein [Gammaproteobacteria bacterium]
MKSFRRLLLPALGLLLIGGCAAPVQYEYNSAPYEQWHNFAWVAPPSAPIRNPVVDSGILATRVEQAVIATLTNQGYYQVATPAQADFVVTYHTALERQQVPNPSVGFSYGWWGYPFSTVIVSQPGQREIQQADLIIDVASAKTKQLVWRGWVTNSPSRSNYSQQAVNEAVAEILSKFPPPPKF